MVTKQQPDLERPHPSRLPLPRPSSGRPPSTSPSIQTTEEAEKTVSDKHVENTLVTKQQPDLEPPRP